ncbi:MAG: hypothetical protein F4W92_08415 [Gammaproteobacteria bacterium]|nr:hypothetical protein [Gammaproteobacteria bacterium]
MSLKPRQLLLRHGDLRLLALVVALVLLPLNAFIADDTPQTSKSFSLDGGPDEGSNTANSLLGGHANVFDQSLGLYETLARANTDELLKLLEDTQEIALRSVRDESSFAIGSRFAEIDPQAAIAQANDLAQHDRDPYLKGIFSEWCVSNLDEAVAAASKLNRNERLVALKAVLKVRDDLTTTQLNEIARELGHPDYASHFESHSTTIEFADDPITAWKVLVDDGLDNFSQIDSLVLVAEALVEKGGYDALFYFYEPFDIQIRVLGVNHFFETVLHALVKNDPDNTWKYLQNGSSQTVDQSNAKNQAQDQTTVSEREKAYMTDKVQHLLMYSWAEFDPETVLASIDQIPPQLRPLACERALTALVSTDSDRTIELIQTLAPYGASGEKALREIFSRWSATDPSTALDWVLSAAETDNISSSEADMIAYIKGFVMRTVLVSFGLVDPERALKVASLQEDSESFQRSIMHELASVDIDSALKLLPSLSRSVKKDATEDVAEALVLVGEIERAMELLHQHEEISAEEVSWYWFFRAWADDYNAVDLFERLDKFEPRLRTAAARALGYIDLPGFTQEQLDYINSIYDWDNPPE